jgi:hypothetical protein
MTTEHNAGQTTHRYSRIVPLSDNPKITKQTSARNAKLAPEAIFAPLTTNGTSSSSRFCVKQARKYAYQ